MKKVYISNVDTPLGYHLVDLIRNDHQDPTSPISIIGSATAQQVPHVYQTINFEHKPQICLRAILQCDLVILDLAFESHQAEVIIKFLSKTNTSLAKPIRVLALSSLMTWQGMKAYQVQKQAQKQKILSSIIDESIWKRIVWEQQNYHKRIPNNIYIKTHQLQNSLLQLNKFTKINATVVAVGLLYGRQNTFLQHQILQSLNGSSLQLFGSGDNLIPLTSYINLMSCIESLINKEKVPYVIVCDKTQYSQRKVKQIINEVTHNNKPIIQKQCLYLTKQECDWSINLAVRPSSLFDQILSDSSFEDYAKESLLEEFCDYNSFKPKQYLVITNQFDQNALKELVQQLKSKLLCVLQQDLDKYNQQMIVKMTPVEDPQARKKNKNNNAKPSSPPAIQKENMCFYAQAFQYFLEGKQYQNFAIVCNQSTYAFLKADLLFSTPTEITLDAGEQLSEGQIIFHSDQYYKQFDLAHLQSRSKQAQDGNTQQSKADEVYQLQKPLRKDEHLILLNQYLLDNVLSSISQAKFSLKVKSKQPTLRNFISELKDIYNKSTSKKQITNRQE